MVTRMETNAVLAATNQRDVEDIFDCCFFFIFSSFKMT